MTASNRSRSGVLLVLGGVASVQLGSASAKGLFPVAGPTGVVWLRLLLAAVVLLVVLRPAVRSLTRGQWQPVVVFGLVLAGMNWAFYESLARIPLGVAVTIEFIGPLGVAVLSDRRWRQAGLVGLAALGIVLLVQTGGEALDRVGLLLAFVAGLFWAAYIIFSTRVGAAVPGIGGLAVALGVGAVATLPVGLPAVVAADTTLRFWLVAGFVALMSSVIPYALELEALRRIPAALFGVLLSLEPAAAALAGLLIIGEQLLGRQWFGIACVVVAAAVATMLSQRTTASPQPG